MQQQTTFRWEKKGLLFRPSIDGFTHGSHPCIMHVRDDLHIIAFTCRNSESKSHIFLSYARVSNGEIAFVGEPVLAFKLGDAGYFDCDGAITASFVKDNNQYYLYYVGWQNLPEGLWICDTGRCILDVNKLELKRQFAGPVLGRDKNNPLFAAATAFFITEDGLWHTWHNSGVKWDKTADGWHHRYGIHHATSKDGIDWDCHPGLAIPFANDYEYAFGRPTVVRFNDMFYMWYAHRATKTTKTYRIGFARSRDCEHWHRDDANSGINISESGWDSEMICYPYVFKHKGIGYMLYNGNNYGRTGFAFAVLHSSEQL